MANPAALVRNRILAEFPTATVEERGRKHLRFRLPDVDGKARHAVVYGVGSLHYHDGSAWQECDTDWRDSDDGAFSDRADRASFKSYVKADGTRRIYPRRDVPGEYVEFGIPDYYTNRWRALPTGVKNRSLDTLAFDGTNVRVEVIPTPDQVKFHFLLKDDSAPTRLRWPMKLVGLALKDGILTSIAEGVVVGSLPAPTMADSSEHHVTRAVTVTYSKDYVEYSANVTGLTYPIDIDPTFEIGAAANDGWWRRQTATIGTRRRHRGGPAR